MSAAKHTPGPWVEHPRDGIPSVGIDVGDGGELLPIVDSVHGRTKAEAKRNRRLIAAAPELLDALQVLHDKTAELIAHLQATDRLRPCFNFPALDSARATIAKASGSAA